MPSNSLLPDIFSNISLRGRRSRTSSRQSSYVSYSVYQQAMTPLIILRDPDATKKLLESIFDSQGGRRSLARLARTCKAMYEPAMNVLWRELDSLVPLIGLFPNHILKRTRRPGLGLSKPPAEEDWNQLLAYGERVERIVYNERSNNVSPTIFPILDEYRPRTVILPNLTTLIWKVDTAAGLDRCLTFITPKVQTVVLEIGNRLPNLRDVLMQLSNRTHLSSLSFTSPSNLPDDFTELLRQQDALEKLALSAPGALSSQVGKWVASQPQLRFLQLDLTGRTIIAVEGFFEEIVPRSGYSTPGSVGGTDSGVYSADEPDFSDIRKSALRLTGDAPSRGTCSQLRQLHLTGEAVNIAAFLKHLNSRLVYLDIVIEDPPNAVDWRDLSIVICEQFGASLQVLRISATGSSKFSELVRSTNREVPLQHLSLVHLTFLPKLYRFEIDLPESVIFEDADIAHLAQTCPSIEVLRLCPLARFPSSPPGLTLEGLAPLTTECRRLHTVAVVFNARSGSGKEESRISQAASSRSLLRLHVGYSWIKDPFQAALLLSHLAPHLEHLKWFQEKNRSVVEAHAQGWQQVSEYLPHLQNLRLDERRAVPQLKQSPPVLQPKPQLVDKAIDATVVLVDQGVLARPRFVETFVQISPEMRDESIEAIPELFSMSVDATPSTKDEGILASPSVSDIYVQVKTPTTSTAVDATVATSSKSVNTVMQEPSIETMSDVSTSTASSEELHQHIFKVPSISGIFMAARDIFFSYPVYLSMRLLNISLLTLGAQSGEAREAETEKEVLSESPSSLISPSSPVTDLVSPGLLNDSAACDIPAQVVAPSDQSPKEQHISDPDASMVPPSESQTAILTEPSEESERHAANSKHQQNDPPSPSLPAERKEAIDPSYHIWPWETGVNNTATRHSSKVKVQVPASVAPTWFNMAEPKKKEKDFTAEVDVIIPEAQSLAKSGKLQEALDKLLALEKQTRNASDLASTTRLVTTICELCYEARDYSLLNSSINILSKKHGQFKATVQTMVELAMSWLEDINEREGLEKWLELMDTLRSVTEGKIFLETPRARVTLLLAHHHEFLAKNPTPTSPPPKESMQTASDLLSELQVETYSSMERREKTEFLLEQMRVLIAVARQKDAEVDKDKKESLAGGDAEWVKVRVGGRKVNEDFLKEKDNEDLKLKFYDLMIQHALHHNAYLDVTKYYYKVWETPSIKEDENGKGRAALEHIVYYIVLASHDNEQSDMLHHLFVDPALSKLELQYNLVKCFTTAELMRWPGIDSLYGPFLRTTSVFHSDQRWEDLHTRVIEHNIRVVAQYYTRITLPRLTLLLDLTSQQTEEILSRLVVSGTIWARIDRPAGMVNFRAKRSAEDVMNDWSSDMQKLLGLAEKAWMGMNAAQAGQSRLKA